MRGTHALSVLLRKWITDPLTWSPLLLDKVVSWHLDSVSSQGTISSIPPDVIDDNDAARDVIDTVVEGRLGGGEKVVYSSKDGPPLQPQDPTPRS